MNSNYLKNTISMISYNFKTLIIFEFLYKIISSLIILPISISSFHFIMNRLGYLYLTTENISSFISYPFTIFIMIFLFILISIFAIFDVSTLIVLFDESYNKNKVGLIDLIKISFSKFKNIFTIKNFIIIFFILLFVPLFNLGISSYLLFSVHIPEILLAFILKHNSIVHIVIFIYLLLIVLLYRYVYSFHYMIIENKNFKNARKYSKGLFKYRLIDIIKIIFVRIIYVLLFLIVLFIGIDLIVDVYRILIYYEVIEAFSSTLVWLYAMIILIIFLIISNSISCAVLSSLFYKHKINKGEKVISIKYKSILRNKNNNQSFHTFSIIVFLISMIGGSIFTYQVMSGSANMNIEFIKETEVTAHRGASKDYPENTFSAFSEAKQLGADWIEIDVQLSKDGEIVVFHDTNLIRMAGINKKIRNMNYKEISKIDIGGLYNDEMIEERIPLLSEVLEYAIENNIRLNIELKQDGTQEDLEQKVVDLVHKYRFEKFCVISSQNYYSLIKVKEITNDLKTVYVMGTEQDDISDYSYADAYSIDATYINEDLIHQAHSNGKEINVWTLNTEEIIEEMINLNVDNITTDDVELCKNMIIKRRNSAFIQDYIMRLEG